MLKHHRVLLLLTTVMSCEQAQTHPAQTPSARTAADTMTTAMREALERFRTTVQVARPATVSGGAASRDDLVSRFVEAVQRADTAALIGMTMNRAEFAYLYYPYSIYTHRPYELDAETTWLLTKGNTEKGLTRILQRFGGQAFNLVSYRCAEPKQEGPNRYWDGCTLTRTIDGAPHTMRWFGSIWERDGHFKFVSYANDM
ncbi:MAG: hypothetical protein ACREMQ_24075 [Longimicrobiales bacterium]